MKKIRYCILLFTIVWISFLNVWFMHILELSITEPKRSRKLDAVSLELHVFPIPTSSLHKQYKIYYEDSFHARRSFGGERVHEGCDLIASTQQRDLYPVLSMTDGVVSNIGYLKLGGYRIGITSKSGHYYYYAHLASYANAFSIGQKICAGEILGFMGDSGYGVEPGTVGQMPVHLHVGIYSVTKHGMKAINPYPYLLELEDKKIELSY
ncbi:MAG: M23 family metallopeptidase [Lachnospiraceae bacterium]